MKTIIEIIMVLIPESMLKNKRKQQARKSKNYPTIIYFYDFFYGFSIMNRRSKNTLYKSINGAK